MRDSLLVLNFNDLYASALAMRLRNERFDCRILPGDTPVEQVMAEGALGLVLAGDTQGEMPAALDGRLLSCGVPVLAMGDTALALVSLLGGQLGEKEHVGEVETLAFADSVITGEVHDTDRYMSVLRPMLLHEDLVPLAHAEHRVVGFMHRQLPIYGFSFQIEPNDPDGTALLIRFAQDICGCTPWLTENAFISSVKGEVARIVGDQGRAICAMTGGLDSGVAALLAHRVLGDRLQCIFIDSGLLREREAEEFLHYYQQGQNMNILRVNAQDRFEAALHGLTDPAEKSAAIGAVYQQVLDETAAGLPFDAVVRGISANDVLRTGDNYITPGIRTDKPVIAPLKELFKEEIRHIGEALGMPPEIHQAQPFPGTGLALRIMGEVTRPRLALLRKADAIFREEIRQAGLHKKLWKYFVVLYHMNFETDNGSLAIALRAVTISNVAGVVKALPARLPYDLQDRCAARVMQAFPEVVRIVNDITPGKSYSEIEWR